MEHVRAKPVRPRADSLGAGGASKVWGGTFHSIGNRLLRRHAEPIGYRPNFSILDDEDSKEMMESAISSGRAAFISVCPARRPAISA